MKIEMSEYVKRLTLPGLWLAQSPENPCPWEASEKPGEVFMRYDQITLAVHPSGDKTRMRIEFWFCNHPVGHIDTHLPRFDLGESFTLQAMRGQVPTEFWSDP